MAIGSEEPEDGVGRARLGVSEFDGEAMVPEGRRISFRSGGAGEGERHGVLRGQSATHVGRRRDDGGQPEQRAC